MLYQDHKRDFSIVDNMLEEANRIRDGAKQAQEVLAKLEDKRQQLHDKCRQKHEEFGQMRAQLQELHQLFKDQEKFADTIAYDSGQIPTGLVGRRPSRARARPGTCVWWDPVGESRGGHSSPAR